MVTDITRAEVFAAFDLWKQVSELSQLSEYSRTLILVWSLIGIIPGEGLGDFYETATATYRDENVASLERIGALKAAVLIRKANEIFARWESEHANQTEREWSHYDEATGSFPEEDNVSEVDHNELAALESQFCDLIEGIESLLDGFVERNMVR